MANRIFFAELKPFFYYLNYNHHETFFLPFSNYTLGFYRTN